MHIRPIRTESDHNSAVARIAGLIGAMPETAEGEELDILATLVDAYEAKHHARTTRPVSECLHSADSAKGRKRLKTYLESQPFPHYEAHPAIQGALIRVEEGGRRTVGHFVNRQFQPTKSPRKAASQRAT